MSYTVDDRHRAFDKTFLNNDMTPPIHQAQTRLVECLTLWLGEVTKEEGNGNVNSTYYTGDAARLFREARSMWGRIEGELQAVRKAK